MKWTKKIGLNVIIIPCLCHILMLPANAAGFIFSWQPFVADINLVLENPHKENLIKNIFIGDVDIPVSEDFRDSLPSSADKDGTPPQKSGMKFLPGNIKLTFNQASSFMPDRLEKYNLSEDEQLSRTIKAMTSLIYSDSRVKSLETIGKTIEPQINFYLEF